MSTIVNDFELEAEVSGRIEDTSGRVIEAPSRQPAPGPDDIERVTRHFERRAARLRAD